jgi:hypothetical protein
MEQLTHSRVAAYCLITGGVAPLRARVEREPVGLRIIGRARIAIDGNGIRRVRDHAVRGDVRAVVMREGSFPALSAQRFGANACLTRG